MKTAEAHPVSNWEWLASGHWHSLQSVLVFRETQPLPFDRAAFALGFQPALFGSQCRPCLAARRSGRQRLSQPGNKPLHGEAFIRQLTTCGLDNHPQDAIFADAPSQGRVNPRLLDIAQIRGPIQIEQQRDSGADLVDMLPAGTTCRGSRKSKRIRRDSHVRRQTKHVVIHTRLLWRHYGKVPLLEALCHGGSKVASMTAEGSDRYDSPGGVTSCPVVSIKLRRRGPDNDLKT